jgi:uncharacterized protein YcnI
MLASALIATSGRSFAHTDTDVVGVPAGSEATVALRPTHGCGDSPTVTVRIRAPLEGARAVPVDGWQETATSDGAGNTVLEWTGGILPADVTGAFPVSFAAPDDPGRLLVFPAVQRCEDGEELAWINGDPTAQYPAPLRQPRSTTCRPTRPAATSSSPSSTWMELMWLELMWLELMWMELTWTMPA